MADISFNGKVKTEGITKEEFLAKFNDAAVKEKAGSIFDKFNTNNTGDSENKLDVKEQAGLLAFLKNLAGADKTISDSEFAAKSEFAKTLGFENAETLSSVVGAYNELATGDEVTFGSDGKTVTVGKNTYTYDDNAAFQSETTGSGASAATRRNKQKYDPVHLSSNWHMQRDVGKAIANGDEGYADIKTKTTAAEVLDAILAKKGLTAEGETKEKLLQTFIKFNPSVFDRETGAVWLDADWTKLDFPAVSEGVTTANMVSDDVDLSDVGKPSTQGWYNSSANFADISTETLKNSESKAGNETSAARYVLDRVLATKMNGILSEENKAKLLGEIIRRNPEVFNGDGKLKAGVTDAQVQAIKIPTMNWIKSKYGVEANGTGGYKKQTSMPTIRGRNGYYAVQSGLGAWVYYNPQGKLISGDDFKKKCPSIYASTQNTTPQKIGNKTKHEFHE